jgi:hypothetical protein
LRLTSCAILKPQSTVVTPELDVMKEQQVDDAGRVARSRNNSDYRHIDNQRRTAALGWLGCQAYELFCDV